MKHLFVKSAVSQARGTVSLFLVAAAGGLPQSPGTRLQDIYSHNWTSALSHGLGIILHLAGLAMAAWASSKHSVGLQEQTIKTARASPKRFSNHSAERSQCPPWLRVS